MKNLLKKLESKNSPNSQGFMYFDSLLSFLLGLLIGLVGFFIFHRSKLGSYQTIAKNILQKAELDAFTLKQQQEFNLKQSAFEKHQELEALSQSMKKKLQKEEERLKIKEEKIESRMNFFEKKIGEVEKQEAILITRKTDLDEEKKTHQEMKLKLLLELEKISCLNRQEAKELLIQKMHSETHADTLNFIRKAKAEAEEEAERHAKTIIATAINRLCISCVSETTVHTVSLPNDEMKGRIIGREGRNIRILEKETGVNFIIDETPMAVVLSGFDPIRILIAKIALSDLISDGRIHPTRIEEAVQKAKETADKQIKQYGEDAALKAGVFNLHPQLIILLGKLKFRFSYGQNVLDHSLEVAHLMGLIAAELHIDIQLAKRIGLLHDIGKALSQEMEGPHAIVGHKIALKYGESEEVANGIGCHHLEMEPTSIEASLIHKVDAMSAARPGARTEAIEEYINRLKKLEEIAYEFEGVDKAYVLQAGREIWISVVPDAIDDLGIRNLAKNLTKRIEQNLSYPGKIKVTVVREKKAIEYAI